MMQTGSKMAEESTHNRTANERNPFLVEAKEASRPRIEILIAQLASTRHYTLNAVRELDAGQLDSPVPRCPNTIGALLAHVAAAETMFQNITCHGHQFAEEEEDLKQAFRFERNPWMGQDFNAYRERLWRVHEGTAELLRGRDDDWLDTPKTFMGRPSNHHYYWTHLLMDEARHTGQIILIRKHLMPGHDPAFHPYATD